MGRFEELVEWFKTAPRINEPFVLKHDGSREKFPVVTVLRPLKFYAALHREIEAGPKHPRRLNGALEEDLETLKITTEERYKSVT